MAGAGLVTAFTSVETGDTYCGTALYDTSTFGDCGSAIALRRIVAAGCALAALGIVAWRTGAFDRSRRSVRLAALGLFVVSAVAALVVVNRLLQPTGTAWCGSVLNRHHTYDAAIESRCDDLLAPLRNTAAVAGVVAAASLWGAIRLWRSALRDAMGGVCGVWTSPNSEKFKNV